MLSFSATFLLLSFTLSRRLFRSSSPSAIGGGLVAKLYLTLATTWTRLLCSWDSPGKNTGVGCYFLFQGIFLTQGLNPGLLHCRQTLYPLSHQGSPTKRRSFLFKFALISKSSLILVSSPSILLPNCFPGSYLLISHVLTVLSFPLKSLLGFQILISSP